MIKATFDIEELERLKDGDHPTFAVLVEQFTPLLHTCCRQQGIREQDLDDVVNDIWLKVYQGLPGYRGEAALSTWLWRVAVHTSVSFIRKQKSLYTSTVPFLPPGSPDPWQQSAEHENLDRLEQALNQLPSVWNTIIKQHYWNHQSTRSIARMMHCQSNYVRVCLCRARKSLRQLLMIPIP